MTSLLFRYLWPWSPTTQRRRCTWRRQELWKRRRSKNDTSTFCWCRRRTRTCQSTVSSDSITSKKSPNVYKSCPNMISLEKLKILTPLQKWPKNVGDLGKVIVAKVFEKLPKVQQITQSGHTAFNQHFQATWSTLAERDKKLFRYVSCRSSFIIAVYLI